MIRHIAPFDLLRILASVGVVAIHAASTAFVSVYEIPRIDWVLTLILASAVRWSVPIFFMISGALLIHPEAGNVAAARVWRKVRSLGLATIFFVAVYAAFDYFIRGDPLSFMKVIDGIIFDQPYKHLWFLFALLQLYAITPWLNRYLRILPRSRLPYLLLLLFLATIAWNATRFIGTLAIPYLSYYVAGYALRDIKLGRAGRAVIKTLFILTTALIALATYWLIFIIHATRNIYFFEFTNFLVVAQTLFVFLWMNGMKLQRSSLRERTAKTTLGIYLIHPIVMYGMQQVLPFPPTTAHALLFTVLGWFGSFGVVSAWKTRGARKRT